MGIPELMNDEGMPLAAGVYRFVFFGALAVSSFLGFDPPWSFIVGGFFALAAVLFLLLGFLLPPG